MVRGFNAIDNTAAEYPTPAIKYSGLPARNRPFGFGKNDADSAGAGRFNTGFFQLLPVSCFNLCVKRLLRHLGNPVYFPHRTGGGEERFS